MLKFKNKYCDEKDDINCNNSNTNIDATLEIIKELNHIKNPWISNNFLDFFFEKPIHLSKFKYRSCSLKKYKEIDTIPIIVVSTKNIFTGIKIKLLATILEEIICWESLEYTLLLEIFLIKNEFSAAIICIYFGEALLFVVNIDGNKSFSLW